MEKLLKNGSLMEKKIHFRDIILFGEDKSLNKIWIKYKKNIL